VRRSRRLIAGSSILVALMLAACGGAVSDEHETIDPASFDEQTGRIEMTQAASDRLDIQTVPILSRGDLLVVPSASLLVEPDGAFYVYTNPEPLVFIPQPISVDRDDGEMAFLSEGPPAGTEVVTVGVPELYGIQYGMGH
jgi:hypothetical protein